MEVSWDLMMFDISGWWLEHDFYFPIQLEIIIPIDQYFSEGLKPPTRYVYSFHVVIIEYVSSMYVVCYHSDDLHKTCFYIEYPFCFTPRMCRFFFFATCLLLKHTHLWRQMQAFDALGGTINFARSLNELFTSTYDKLLMIYCESIHDTLIQSYSHPDIHQ